MRGTGNLIGARWTAAALLALLIGAPPARAQGRGAIHLGAGDCFGAGSSSASLTNACQSNTGVMTLVASFSPPVTVPNFCGLESIVNVFTGTSALSPWWHLEHNPSAGCRAGRISASFDFTSGPTTCEDYWSGRAVGGMDYAINKDGLGPNTARIFVICAIDQTQSGPISSSSEYYAFSIVIQKSQSSGPGSCAGCSDKACFAINYINLGQPAPASEYLITQGSQSVVTYNGGSGGPHCAASTTQKSSWGAIKAIYRY